MYMMTNVLCILSSWLLLIDLILSINSLQYKTKKIRFFQTHCRNNHNPVCNLVKLYLP